MAGSAFLDFHLLVNQVQGEPGTFVVVVAGAPVPRWQRYRFDRFPGRAELEDLLGRYPGFELIRDPRGIYHLRSGTSGPGETSQRDARWQVPLRTEHGLCEALFSLLFAERSHALFLLGRSCQQAAAEKKSLRIRLELPPELSYLPWEAVRCPLDFDWTEEIHQTRKTILRYLGDYRERRGTPGGASSDGKATLLIVKASPHDVPRAAELETSFANERQRIEEILRHHSDRLECVTIEGHGTLARFKRGVDDLKRGDRRLVGLHFIGHGDDDERGSFLVGEDERSGGGERIYESDLRDALDGVSSLRWVILNACSTAFEPIGCPLAGLATSLAVLKNVPTVIAYKRPVETGDAEALGTQFYSLVMNQRLAVEEAVRHLQLLLGHPGGLVALARSIDGRIETSLGIEDDDAAAAPGSEAVAEPEQPEPPAQTVRGAPDAAAPARRQPVGEDAVEMALVPAGRFRKGLDPEQVESLIEQFRDHGLTMDLEVARAALRQETVEEVDLPAFEVDVTPVTNARFRAFVETTHYMTEAERLGAPRTWRTYDVEENDSHPVVVVSSNDAREFCRWAGKRLPTADEWKKACRGGDGQAYPWGAVFECERCNSAEGGRGFQTTPVTRFPLGCSPYGCFDMVGNVEEWTATEDATGALWVLGGSWSMHCQIYGLPVLHRLASPSFYSNEHGFRCVRDVAG